MCVNNKQYYANTIYLYIDTSIPIPTIQTLYTTCRFRVTIPIKMSTYTHSNDVYKL